MLQSAIQFLRRQPAWVILLMGLVLVAATGYFDAITGPDLTFAHFYLLPVLFVTWLQGRRWGYCMAVASALACLVAERMGAAIYSNPQIQEWNLLMRLGFFIGAVWLLSMWRSIGVKLAEMVEVRTAELREQVAQREKAQQDLSALAAQLSAAEDAERRKLAYDIHDSLSQMLSLLKINLDAAALEAPAGTKLQSRLLECARTTEDLIRQTRTLTFDLHPAMLDDLGLVPTLQRYADEFESRTEADVTVTENGLRRQLGSPLANYLFRAIKELMSNAVKHGNAREIIISAHWEPSALRIVVDDDGQGFDSRAALSPETRRGLGLAGIDQRLTSIGGRLDIESNSDQGARIILEIPLRSELLQDNTYVDASLAG
jgi:signal transduction histidine kinase